MTNRTGRSNVLFMSRSIYTFATNVCVLFTTSNVCVWGDKKKAHTSLLQWTILRFGHLISRFIFDSSTKHFNLFTFHRDLGELFFFSSSQIILKIFFIKFSKNKNNKDDFAAFENFFNHFIHYPKLAYSRCSFFSYTIHNPYKHIRVVKPHSLCAYSVHWFIFFFKFVGWCAMNVCGLAAFKSVHGKKASFNAKNTCGRSLDYLQNSFECALYWL